MTVLQTLLSTGILSKAYNDEGRVDPLMIREGRITYPEPLNPEVGKFRFKPGSPTLDLCF